MIKNSILQEDLEIITRKILTDKSFLNSNILITGATGLIGSLLIKSILYANQALNTQIKIFAHIRSYEKAHKVFEEFIPNTNLVFINDDLSKSISTDYSFDYIIHTASITASKEMVENPTDVLLTAFNSTKQLLEYLKIHTNCKMVYVSSMEYYGQVHLNPDNVTEDCLGYIDLSNPRSCYPESKRVCEALCNAYVTQYQVQVSMARLAQTFGAGVSFTDNRVFAQFAKSVLFNKDIILHTSGHSEGNYCYTSDAIYALFLLLLKGKAGESYNVSYSHSTILNMAKLVSEKISSGKIKVIVEIPQDLNQYGYAPDVKMKLNSNKLAKLGWSPSINLEQSFKRMIESWRLEEKYNEI